MAKPKGLTVKDVMSGKRRCINSEEAPKSKEQQTVPCGDCPFARNALRGWLGGNTVEQWVVTLNGDHKIPCHAIRGPQCAGAAILRSNICKRPRDKSVLLLPADRKKVFAGLHEFKEHHSI
jgi:hypothetical protein